MSAATSLLTQCSECCTNASPLPVIQYKDRSRSQCSYIFSTDGTSYYQDRIDTYDFSWSDSGSGGTAGNGCPGPKNAYIHSASGTATVTATGVTGSAVSGPLTGSSSVNLTNYSYGGDCGPSDCGFALVIEITESWPFGSTGSQTTKQTLKPCTGGKNSSVTFSFFADLDDYGFPYEITTTYDNVVVPGTFRSDVIDMLGEYSSEWTDEPQEAIYDADAAETSYCVSVKEFIYRIAFPVPTVSSCYRVRWAERFIPKNGTGIDSIEVIYEGAYRPSVTASGVSGCYLIAVMSSSGEVDSIKVVNPGSGYLSAPIITVEEAINGGTRSTGWVATISAGKVVSVSGGSGGNYLPTVSFSGGDGDGASAVITLNEQGGIDTIDVESSGSGYVSEPTVFIEAKSSSASDATFFIHMGTETMKCANWNGSIPDGYDPDDINTWPTLPVDSPGYVTVDVPEAEGTTTIVNAKPTFSCQGCP